MRFFRYLLIAALCIVAIPAVLNLKNSLVIKKKILPKIEVIKEAGVGNAVNIYLTRPQLKVQISPLIVKDLLAHIRVAGQDDGGLKLLDFKDNGLLSKYGFKKGDTLKSINGRDINTPKEALNACDALKEEVFGTRDEKEIEVMIKRDGEDINMNFKVAKFVAEKVSYGMTLNKRGDK
ncbi:MAG: hypothetical protein HQ558_04375 [Candidatus Omnitrophica bacterium]|nr:hypothetical protein [Candidatus Omnitrophota bacterium]